MDMLESAHIEYREMAEELFARADEVPATVEFVGFESAPTAEPILAENDQTNLPAVVKLKRRHRAKPRKRLHAVRVCFDDRELAKLTGRAGAEGLALPEFVRVRALRDPRPRTRQAVAPADDLFARANLAQMTVVRLAAQLTPEMEARINAYFSSADRFSDEPPFAGRRSYALSRRPKILAKLGYRLMEFVGSRLPRHHSAPPAEI